MYVSHAACMLLKMLMELPGYKCYPSHMPRQQTSSITAAKDGRIVIPAPPERDRIVPIEGAEK